MTEFELAGINYRTGKLNVKEKDRVVRRLLPLITAMSTAADGESDNALGMFASVAQSYSRLADADVEFIQDTCLRVVRRQQGDNWVGVLSSNGLPMFDDIGLLELNVLVFRVLEDNLKAFFSGIGQTLSGLIPGL